MAEEMFTIQDGGNVLMSVEVAELSETILELVSTNPEVVAFAEAYCVDRELWEPAQVIRVLMLQAITIGV